MCLSLPAQVVAVQAHTVVVKSDVTIVAVGDGGFVNLQPGEWVLVYTGHIVDRIPAEDAEALQDLLEALRVIDVGEKGEQYQAEALPRVTASP